MSNKWQPPRLGAKQEDEISCWAFGINHRWRETPKVAKAIKDLEGLVGVYPEVVHGSLVFFQTMNDAICGRNLVKDDFPCGGISEVFLKKEYLSEGSKE